MAEKEMTLAQHRFITPTFKELVVKEIQASLKEREDQLHSAEVDKALSCYSRAFWNLSRKLFNLGEAKIKSFGAPELQELDKIIFQEIQKILRLRKLAIVAVAGLGLVPPSLIIIGLNLSPLLLATPLAVVGVLGTIIEIAIGVAGLLDSDTEEHPFKKLVNSFQQIDNDTADNLKIYLKNRKLLLCYQTEEQISQELKRLTQ